MNPTEIRKLGKSGAPLTQLGFGGAPLGELFVRVDEATAAATLQAAWDAGVRYYDTAPYYGRGLSEIRYGRFLDAKPRSEFVLSSKVGRWFFPPAKPDEVPDRPGLGGRAAVRTRARLQLRRDHALLRAFADAARHEPHRPALDPRSRLLVPHDRGEGRGLSRPAIHFGLARSRPAAFAWPGARRRSRNQRAGHDCRGFWTRFRLISSWWRFAIP